MTDSDLILALDQGTTSSRAILFDRDGAMQAIAQQATTQQYPEPGWVNQDATEIWDTTIAVARAALQRVSSSASVVALGIANQRETTILWNRADGRPVAPVVVWQSRQSAPLVRAIADRGMSEAFRQRTGLVPDAYFSATKIAWLLDEHPELRRRAEAGDILFGTVDSWLLWHLSGGQSHLTDASNAARTMLYDIHRGDWSDELLGDLAIPRTMLPEVRGNSEIFFETPADLFGVPIPVAGAAGDQHAALFGQACFTESQAKNTYGTGSFLLMNTGTTPRESRNQLLTTIAWEIGGSTIYALEGAIFVTGAAVQWLRDGLGIIPDSASSEALAGSVPDSGGVVFVPALVGLGSPYWDPRARGTIVGITRGTTAAHLARATLEAIAFQTRDVLTAMSDDAGVDVAELRVDGGAARNDLLLQIQADVLGIPIVRPKNVETTALGAAYLAGLATGMWRDQTEIAAHWQVDRRFEPSVSSDVRDDRYATWRQAVERSRDWAD